MKLTRLTLVACLAFMLLSCTSTDSPPATSSDSIQVRIATFNIEDVRTQDVHNPENSRLVNIGHIIRRLNPDIILLNEISFDQPGAPYTDDDQPAGMNAQWFANNFLNTSGDSASPALHYHAFMLPSNTGMHSGHDLNNDGIVAPAYPEPPGTQPDGRPGSQTTAGRHYGNDCWGFGTFPGQYAMAVLVKEDIEILEDQARSFGNFLWMNMPNALLPVNPVTGQSWYNMDELSGFPLSSKNHWDLPVKLANGAVIHLLCSHPTPPAFDGPEERNKRRNHDEIRFWADYIDGADYIKADDDSRVSFEQSAHFVVMGDLNADPDEGSSIGNPIGSFLLNHELINGAISPQAESHNPKLDPDDTTLWGLRVDYVLPSKTLNVTASGVWRYPPTDVLPVSDHFPVWIDVMVPPAVD